MSGFCEGRIIDLYIINHKDLVDGNSEIYSELCFGRELTARSED